MRYLPLTPDDRTAMLSAIGVSSIDDLFVDVPGPAQREGFVDLPRVAGELEVERALSKMANRNLAAGSAPFFCGAGAYKHHVPATVDHVIQRSEFLTSYTPYQPEIAQGTLQYLYEFQTQVANLTGMPVANASLYDGSTAMAEGVLMATRVTRRNKAVISGGVHPHYVRATETVVHAVGVETEALTAAIDAEAAVIDAIDKDTACVVVQTPNVFGTATDVTKIAEAAHAAGALLIVVVTEAVSMGLLKSPGEMGADIVAAEGQSIGNALNYGGPYVGLFATRDKLVRQMPGRLTGETVDADGERGFVLTLSTLRAAHPSRQGDVEHLYELRPLHPGLHHPHEPAGRDGAAQDGPAEPRKGPGHAGRPGRHPRRGDPDPALLQRVRGAPAQERGRGRLDPGRPSRAGRCAL